MRTNEHLGKVAVAVVAMVCLSGAGWGAESKKDKSKSKEPPPWMKTVTLVKPGKEPELKPCRMRYSLSWNNLIDAGEVSIEMRSGGKSEDASREVLAGEASARSTGMARLLWAYDCELEARASKVSLRPLWFEHSETENDEKVSYRTEFKPGRVETLRYGIDSETGKKTSKKRTFKYGDVYGLLSSILCLRSQALKNGETVVAVVQPFDSPYLVSFNVQGREKRKYRGSKKDTIRLGIEIQKINKDLSLKKYKKMKTATLWVSEDEYRLPLEIRADIFVGYVAATLVSREFTDASEASPRPPTKTGMSTIVKDSANQLMLWWKKQSGKNAK